MTLADRELARRFKEEADEIWFRDVRFDDALKQKVRDRIREDRASDGKRMRVRKTALGALTLASAAALLLVIVPPVSPDRQPASTAVLSGGDGREPAPAGVPGDTFVMEGTTAPAPFLDGTSPEASAAQEGVSWTPLSVEEAAEAFGPGFALPGWLPDGFSLRQIGAFGEREGEAHAVTLTYMAEERAFWLTLRKAERPEFFPARQTVDVGGVVGYLNAAPPPGEAPAPEAGTDGASSGATPAEAGGTVPANPPQESPQGAESGTTPLNVPPDAPRDAASGTEPVNMSPDAPRGTRPGTAPANAQPEAPVAPWPTTELYWFAGGIQYELHGAITAEEVVRIARSIPLAPEVDESEVSGR